MVVMVTGGLQVTVTVIATAIVMVITMVIVMDTLRVTEPVTPMDDITHKMYTNVEIVELRVHVMYAIHLYQTEEIMFHRVLHRVPTMFTPTVMVIF